MLIPAPPTVLLTYPFLRLLLHAGPQPTFETEWLGFAGSQEFRDALTEVIRLAHEHRPAGWVANDHHLGAVRPKDLDWVIPHVLQPLGSLGLARFAHFEAHEALNRLTIKSMYQRIIDQLPYQIKSFATLAEARNWATGAA